MKTINLNKGFENLTEVEKMILSLKGALNEIRKSDNEEEKAFYGAFIAHTQMELKEMGADAFEYKII
jgi:hypothetical protein